MITFEEFSQKYNRKEIEEIRKKNRKNDIQKVCLSFIDFLVIILMIILMWNIVDHNAVNNWVENNLSVRLENFNAIIRLIADIFITFFVTMRFYILFLALIVSEIIAEIMKAVVSKSELYKKIMNIKKYNAADEEYIKEITGAFEVKVEKFDVENKNKKQELKNIFGKIYEDGTYLYGNIKNYSLVGESYAPERFLAIGSSAVNSFKIKLPNKIPFELYIGPRWYYKGKLLVDKKGKNWRAYNCYTKSDEGKIFAEKYIKNILEEQQLNKKRWIVLSFKEDIIRISMEDRDITILSSNLIHKLTWLPKKRFEKYFLKENIYADVKFLYDVLEACEKYIEDKKNSGDIELCQTNY